MCKHKQGILARELDRPTHNGDDNESTPFSWDGSVTSPPLSPPPPPAPLRRTPQVRKPTLTTPSPASYAKAGIAAIGYEAVVSPYWAHKLQLWVMALIPGSTKVVFSMHKSLRARALKKLAAKKD